MPFTTERAAEGDQLRHAVVLADLHLAEQLLAAALEAVGRDLAAEQDPAEAEVARAQASPQPLLDQLAEQRRVGRHDAHARTLAGELLALGQERERVRQAHGAG